MFKTLSAAVIAASTLVAPIAASAAQPATTPAIVKSVEVVKVQKRYVVKAHKRVKFVRQAGHHHRFVTVKRSAKFVRAYKHHGRIVKITTIQKRVIVKKVRTSAR